jgi:hypothetical protein
MKYFYIFILLIIFILFILYLLFKNYIVIEGFSSDKTYILLGDSILKNDAYVKDGNSIEKLLIKHNSEINLYSFAEDNSKIIDIYSQISKIPVEVNNQNTYVFLSAGGNDILAHYVDQNEDITDTSILKPMFSSYKNLIKSILSRIPNAKIVLLDIYYPDNLTYQRFHSIIKEWNNMIYYFVSKQSKNIYSILKISEQLTQGDDFSFGIEPSSNGGKKIVNLMLSI